ncbi:hypothetical protein FRC06_003715, partial [Ceratobasidium sp. 370]
ILCKFGIENRVWGVAGDNAKNNKRMMVDLESYSLAWLTGLNCHVMCMAHILNLVAQSIMSGFCKHKPTEADNADDDDFDFCIDFDKQLANPGDIDKTDNVHALLWTLQDDDKLLSKIDLPEIVPNSPEGLELICVGTVIWKVAKFAHEIWFLPWPRNFFKEQCEERELGQPHNSMTFPAIIVTQAELSFGIPRSH